jgi:hypothetical protein
LKAEPQFPLIQQFTHPGKFIFQHFSDNDDQVSSNQIARLPQIVRQIEDKLNFLKLKFSITQLLRLGKTLTPLVTLKISQTSFHFRIYKMMTKRKTLKVGYRAAIGCLIFEGFP